MINALLLNEKEQALLYALVKNLTGDKKLMFDPNDLDHEMKHTLFAVKHRLDACYDVLKEVSKEKP